MKSISGLLAACALLVSATSCQAPQAAVKSTDQVVATKSYPLKIAFQADFAVPTPEQGAAMDNRAGFWQPGGTRINTQGQGYFLTLDGNSVNADLPYYGQRDLFRDMYGDLGITFDDKALENITYGRTSDNKVVALEFNVRRNSERFHVQLVIMPSKKAYLTLNSPQRKTIRYEGTVASL